MRWKWAGPNSAWVIEGMRDEGGKRVRKFFPSRDEANEWLRSRRPDFQNQGRAAMGLPDKQRVDAIQALSILAPHNANLTTAARAFHERATLVSHTVMFAKLREELVATKKKDKKSARYVSDLRSRLAAVGRTFDERPVATIETRELDDWLRALRLAPTSRINFRKVMRTAFEFAILRGYATDNPVVRTEKVKAGDSPPGILTPVEIAAMLSVADPMVAAAIALSAFGGLRDAEVKKSGPVRPSQRVGYPLYRAARRRAAAKLVKQGHTAKNMKNWPTNAFRHSFASYRLAMVNNAAQVAEECGHSVHILKKHYRELVTKAEAVAWFGVVPGLKG
jgi:hypothetical protein